MLVFALYPLRERDMDAMSVELAQRRSGKVNA